MALKKQSIRSTMTILVEGVEIPKDELITLSESWSEQQESFFRKMLKQGGKFKVKGLPFEIRLKERILTSKGEKDGGIQQIPGEKTF